jgi:hypothetical protein
MSTSSDADDIDSSVEDSLVVDSPIPTTWSWPLENDNDHALINDDTLLLHANHYGDASSTVPQVPLGVVLAGLDDSANAGPAAASDQHETARPWSLSQFVTHHERIDDVRLGRSDRAAKRVHTQHLMAQLDIILAILYPIN